MSDSTMWQSRLWSHAVDTVYRFDTPRRLINHRLLLALRLLWARRHYELVITTGNQVTLYYGLLCRLLFVDPRQVVTQLYLDERRGLLRYLHDPLMRFVLRRASGVVVPSRGEVGLVAERFGVPTERIRFVPYHTNIAEPRDLGCSTGYIFAGGRNFRDYETLLDAVDGLDVDVEIVCGADQLRGHPIPPKVTVRREIPWSEYLALLYGAQVVVVPLSTEVVPSGQVAILEAMGHGKPVITTRSVGTVDYVRDGVNGLLYELGDAQELRAQLERLTGDPDLRARIGRAAYDITLDEFTFDRHVERKLQAIRELGRPLSAAAKADAM